MVEATDGWTRECVKFRWKIMVLSTSSWRKAGEGVWDIKIIHETMRTKFLSRAKRNNKGKKSSLGILAWGWVNINE